MLIDMMKKRIYQVGFLLILFMCVFSQYLHCTNNGKKEVYQKQTEIP